MDLQKIYNDNDFENAVVPEGQILVFNSIEDGKVVTRYKDSSGNFGTMAGEGGGGGGSVDVILGQVDADGNFQPLTFNGTEASDSGSPEAVENYYGWQGVLPVPDDGIKVGEATEYYKCASVDTVNKTWTGYKAVLTDGVYSFEETVTEGLPYDIGFIPVTGKIYNTDATVAVSGLYEGIDPSLVFYAPLSEHSTNAMTGQSITEDGYITYSVKDGRECARFIDGAKLVISDLSKIPFGDTPHTICGWFYYEDFSQYGGLFGYGNEYAIRCINTSGECDVVYYKDTRGAFSYNITSGNWYHIATAYDGEKIRLYINGSLEGEQTNKPDFENVESRPMHIGNVPRTGSCNGYVSDMRIYSRSLSESEILALSSAPTA